MCVRVQVCRIRILRYRCLEQENKDKNVQYKSIEVQVCEADV